MENKLETKIVLEEILDLLQSESKKNIGNIDDRNKIDKRKSEALNKLQSSFDRIHDKLFVFNNILLVAILGLCKFPTENPIFNPWTIVIPVINLIFLITLEKSQMEIFRHEAYEDKWSESDLKKHGDLIINQNLRSLAAIISTSAIFIYFIICLLIY